MTLNPVFTVALLPTDRRFYPNSAVPIAEGLDVHAARGERVSCQVVVRTDSEPAEIAVSLNAPEGVEASVRRVGFVPMNHLNTETPLSEIEGAGNVPGFVPDPLYREDSYLAGAYETNSFWITLCVGVGVNSGEFEIPVKTKVGDSNVDRMLRLVVHRAILPLRQGFPVTHWLYCDALCDYYGVEPFGDEFWPIVTLYMRNLVDHGNDVMHTPIFTPPTDGVKRPTQLLCIVRTDNKYNFDWSAVKRFVDLAKQCGLKYFEWSHFFSQWGCKNAIRIYEGDPSAERLLWPADTPATSPVYRSFLEQFIPNLRAFLERERILDVSFFHISDEPHGDEALANYRVARAMMRELAPWMKFMDALSQIGFASEGLVDHPIPSIETATGFVDAGYRAWCYFCCGPRGAYLNRLMDTPLAKIRMSGWLFYRLKSNGFLHWGYNYWYKSQTRQIIDPYRVQDGTTWPGWAYGDPFVVYPGQNGPIDSIRWEVFAESLQDYALLQASGISPDDPMLADIKGYDDFPKTSQWIMERRIAVLTALDAKD